MPSVEHVIERLNLCIERECAKCERLYHVSNERPPNDCYSDLLRLARDTLQLQAKELRPVVTCGECEYWEDDWEPRRVVDGNHYCPVVDMFKPADWFCAEGKKREGE